MVNGPPLSAGAAAPLLSQIAARHSELELDRSRQAQMDDSAAIGAARERFRAASHEDEKQDARIQSRSAESGMRSYVRRACAVSLAEWATGYTGKRPEHSAKANAQRPHSALWS